MNYTYLKSNATIRITLWFRVIFLCFWVTLTIVDGYGKYDAVPPLPFNCVSHVGFWAMIEIIVLATGFSLCPNEKNSSDVTNESMVFWTCLLILAIIANIVHIVTCALELNKCLSTLCLMNSGFLVATVVFLGLLICLEIFEIYTVSVFRRNIKEKNL